MGCDVSKGYSDFIVLGKRKRTVVEPFQLDDTFEGHSSLSGFMSNFFIDYPGANLYVGLESTGGYEDNWYGLLLRLSEIYSLKVARLNPLPVKKHHEASMGRNVTDQISAKNIASYLISYPEKVSYDKDIAFKDLRKQWTLIQLMTKQRTQYKNELESLMYQSNPELIKYCKDGISNWISDILINYPTAGKLARARPDTLAKIPYISFSKAQSLIENAKKSIAAHVSETDEFIIKETVRQINNLDTAINNQKQHLKNNCTSTEVDILCSFVGINWLSALGLLINIVAIARFPTVKHLVSYFGLHPIYKQSGDSSWGYHMSKQGRKQPRSILFLITLSSVRYNPVIKKLYEDCLGRGMKRMAAIGVCMHKILRIVYGILKSNKAFNPKIDEMNQRKNKAKSKEGKQSKKRRFQSHDQSAPISRRQTKTRKEKEEEKEPQESVAYINGVIPPSSIKENTICTIKSNRDCGPERVGEIIMHAIANYIDHE